MTKKFHSKYGYVSPEQKNVDRFKAGVIIAFMVSVLIYAICHISFKHLPSKLSHLVVSPISLAHLGVCDAD